MLTEFMTKHQTWHDCDSQGRYYSMEVYLRIWERETKLSGFDRNLHPHIAKPFAWEYGRVR